MAVRSKNDGSSTGSPFSGHRTTGSGVGVGDGLGELVGDGLGLAVAVGVGGELGLGLATG
jgi:hypothetical protein